MSDTETTSAVVVTTPEQERAVHQTSIDYVESWYAGDAARMADAIHPELNRRFLRSFPSGAEFLEETGASKLVEWTRSGGGRPSVAEQYRVVTVLDCYFRAATAKAVTWSGVEYLQLGRFGDDWKIVNVLGESRVGGPFELSSTSSPSDGLTRSEADPADVVAAALDYAQGWYTADTARVSRVTHPQWSKKGVRRTESGGFFLESWGAEKMTTWTGSDEHRAERRDKGLERCDVTVLDQHAGIAAVRLRWDFDRASDRPGSVDYLALARSTDGWRAVNILWEDDRSESEHAVADGAAGWVL